MVLGLTLLDLDNSRTFLGTSGLETAVSMCLRPQKPFLPAATVALKGMNLSPFLTNVIITKSCVALGKPSIMPQSSHKAILQGVQELQDQFSVGWPQHHLSAWLNITALPPAPIPLLCCFAWFQSTVMDLLAGANIRNQLLDRTIQKGFNKHMSRIHHLLELAPTFQL